MMKFIMAFVSLLPAGLLYIIVQYKVINDWLNIKIPFLSNFWYSNVLLLFVFSIIFILVFNCLVICIYGCVVKDDNKKIDKDINIKSIDVEYLPVYLGYFLIALEVDDAISFVLLMLFVVILVYKIKGHFYNPILLILGYRFFILADGNNEAIVIVSKKNLTNFVGELKHLKRVDGKIYIDAGGKDT